MIAAAKMEFGELDFFNLVKGYLNPHHYVECGNCGAVEVECRELIRVIIETPDEELGDMVIESLDKLLDPPPENYGRQMYEDWVKWNEENKHRIFIDEWYDEGTCVKYEKVVLFLDPACNCFHQDKIKDLI